MSLRSGIGRKEVSIAHSGSRGDGEEEALKVAPVLKKDATDGAGHNHLGEKREGRARSGRQAAPAPVRLMH